MPLRYEERRAIVDKAIGKIGEGKDLKKKQKRELFDTILPFAYQAADSMKKYGYNYETSKDANLPINRKILDDVGFSYGKTGSASGQFVNNDVRLTERKDAFRGIPSSKNGSKLSTFVHETSHAIDFLSGDNYTGIGTREHGFTGNRQTTKYEHRPNELFANWVSALYRSPDVKDRTGEQQAWFNYLARINKDANKSK